MIESPVNHHADREAPWTFRLLKLGMCCLCFVDDRKTIGHLGCAGIEETAH